MAGLRKASSYSKRRAVPFTRVSKKKGKSYIKTVPPQKIFKFSMGSETLYDEGKLPYQLTVVADEYGQVRNNALEACREYVHKELEKSMAGQYLFRVIIYPHHIQRENKMLTGAGSDRMQTGMQLSYGKSVGKAALVKAGTKIFLIAVQTPKQLVLARELLRRVKPKMPIKTSTNYEERRIKAE
jgi:large subunit ribosomal protein L10e